MGVINFPPRLLNIIVNLPSARIRQCGRYVLEILYLLWLLRFMTLPLHFLGGRGHRLLRLLLLNYCCLVRLWPRLGDSLQGSLLLLL